MAPEGPERDGFEEELVKHLLGEDDLRLTDLDRARVEQARRGCGLATALLDLGLVPEARLLELRAEILGEPREPDDSELISQTSFEAIYETPPAALPPSGRLAPRRPGDVPTPVVRALKVPDPAPAQPATTPAPVDRATTPAPGYRATTPAPVDPGPAPIAPAEAEPRAEAGAGSGSGADRESNEESATLDLVDTVNHWHSDPSQEIQPLEGLTEARAMLARATSRQEIGLVLARHALAKAPRVVLLARRGRTWVGWTGAGAGIRPERVARLVVPPVKGCVFGLVADTGAHYLGPLVAHPVHERFYRTLGVPAAGAVGIFPVHCNGQIEMALFLDAGPDGRLGPDVGEVLLVAMEVPRALAKLGPEASD